MKRDCTPGVPDESCTCPRTKHTHGTNTNYLLHACRGDACREAMTTKHRQMRKQKAYGRWNKTRVPAQPARDHINHLRNQGLGVTTIAKKAGISHATIARILYGEPYKNTPPATLIDPTTEQAILNTRPFTNPGHLVNATGTRRRIQALARQGWPLRHQAQQAGIHHDQINEILTNKHVQHKTAATIAAMFKRLQLVKPAPRDKHHKRAITLITNHATRNQWPPPLAWDLETIDDPRARPKDHTYRKGMAA